MANDVSVELWLDKRRLAALDKALSDEGDGRGTEKYMQDRLIELYCEIVPSDIQTAIDQELEAERLAAERLAEDRRRVCAFHVTEDGQSQYFSVGEGFELLEVAKKVRAYLTAKPAERPASFAKMFLHCADISAERFDELTGIRMDNTGKVTGIFDLDFDKREFSAVNIMKGWITYAMGDVSTAVYHATRSRFLSTEQQWEKLLNHLDSKELTSAGHLSARNVSFSDEIVGDDGKLNFYMDCAFDVDAVFGTHVCTDENDDSINIYADYDMERQQVCDALDIVLWKADGQCVDMTYTLNAAEKEVLRRAMDEHCLKQTGMALTDYAAQRMAEDTSPKMEPTM